MCKTNDKARFTFRIPKDIDEYLIQKSKQWRTSKTGVLIRIILEYAESNEEKQKLV